VPEHHTHSEALEERPLKFIAVSLILMLLASCAGKITIVPLSTRDPADPASPEGVSTPLNPLMAQERAGDSLAAPAEEAVFSCPMHSSVRQELAGHCSVCGMELVKKGSEQPEPGSLK